MHHIRSSARKLLPLEPGQPWQWMAPKLDTHDDGSYNARCFSGINQHSTQAQKIE
jgi:hypothetical protein